MFGRVFELVYRGAYIREVLYSGFHGISKLFVLLRMGGV